MATRNMTTPTGTSTLGISTASSSSSLLLLESSLKSCSKGCSPLLFQEPERRPKLPRVLERVSCGGCGGALGGLGRFGLLGTASCPSALSGWTKPIKSNAISISHVPLFWGLPSRNNSLRLILVMPMNPLSCALPLLSVMYHLRPCLLATMSWMVTSELDGSTSSRICMSSAVSDSLPSVRYRRTI